MTSLPQSVAASVSVVAPVWRLVLKTCPNVCAAVQVCARLSSATTPILFGSVAVPVSATPCTAASPRVPLVSLAKKMLPARPAAPSVGDLEQVGSEPLDDHAKTP